MTGKALSREEILGIEDLVTEAVEVPEWGGGVVHVRTMTGAERDEFEQRIYSARPGQPVDRRNIRARLIAQCAVNGTGERLFTEEDIEELGAKSARALDRLFSVAQRLNGLRAEDIEELAGN